MTALDIDQLIMEAAEHPIDETGPAGWRRRLGLVQLAVFTVVVIVVLTVQYLEVVR